MKLTSAVASAANSQLGSPSRADCRGAGASGVPAVLAVMFHLTKWINTPTGYLFVWHSFRLFFFPFFTGLICCNVSDLGWLADLKS